MVKNFKSEAQYLLLVDYLKEHSDEDILTLEKKLLKKKWPETWVFEAKKDAFGHSLMKRAHLLTNKHKKEDMFSRKTQTLSEEDYIKKLFEKHHHQIHFYDKALHKEVEEPKKLPEVQPQINVPQNLAVEGSLLKEAMELARQIVLNKDSTNHAPVKNVFDFEVQQKSVNEEQLEIEKQKLEQERIALELERKKLKLKSAPATGDNSEKLEIIERKLLSLDSNKRSDESSYRNPVILDELDYADEPIGDRAQTGIKGLDSIIQGGFRRKSINLLGGGPGSGKTIFGMQYLVNGAREFNENGVYITFEQDQDEIERLFDEMGWDLEELEKQKKVIILRIDPEQIHKLLEAGGGTLRDSIEGINAKRVVIDSISDFLLLYKTDLDKRTAVTDLFNLLAKMKVTSLIISEQETDPLKHVTSIIEYQVDGVILLYNERIGHVRQRALEIFKMRGTKHAGRILPMVISNNGVSIRVGS